MNSAPSIKLPGKPFNPGVKINSNIVVGIDIADVAIEYRKTLPFDDRRGLLRTSQMQMLYPNNRWINKVNKSMSFFSSYGFMSQCGFGVFRNYYTVIAFLVLP